MANLIIESPISQARRRWHVSFRLNTYAYIPGVLEEMYRNMFSVIHEITIFANLSHICGLLEGVPAIKIYIKDRKFPGGSANYLYILASGMQDGSPTAKFCVIKFYSRTRFLALIGDQSICHFPET